MWPKFVFYSVLCQGNNLNLNLGAMNLNLNLPGISSSGNNLHLSDLPSVSINSLERKHFIYEFIPFLKKTNTSTICECS